MEQLTIFEETTIKQDPLYQLINSLMVSEVKEIDASGKILRVELKNIISGTPIYEYETTEVHGLAKGIKEMYDTIRVLIDSEFNKQLI